MKTYLAFLQNLKTEEEFVAPVTAATHDEALMTIGEKYPPRFFKMQTFYTLADMKRIMADVERWPGVASTVQPMVEQLNKRVVTGGPLPLMPGQAAKVTLKDEAPAPVMSAIEAIRAAQATGSRLETHEEAPVAPAEVTRAPATPKRTVAAVMSRPASANAPSASVLDVLKALRG